MIICCTQRAAKEFSFGPSQLEPVVAGNQSPHEVWYAHVFYIGRLKCLVLTHGASLFSAVKEGYKRIDQACPEEVGASPEAIKKGSDGIDKITYAKATDKRVLGSMNDMIKLYKYGPVGLDPR